MLQTDLARSVDAVRRFTRFYTRKIGVLHEGLLGSPLSLTEARVLYELAQSDIVTATELGKELGLDAGYLSRILRSFLDKGLIQRQTSASDGRQSIIGLTDAGRSAFEAINARSRDEVAEMVVALDPADRARLAGAMLTIETLLKPAASAPRPVTLRFHRPGDMGFITHRQAVLYAQEYGWDETFEALVAEIAAAFIRNFDPQRERCWIAEMDGEIVGSVFIVKQSDDAAKLRLLYVEPKARGSGLGRRLVEECIRFARDANYKQITLWTNDILHAARRIYVEAGFTLVEEERHHSFGHELVGQNWRLELSGGEIAAGSGAARAAPKYPCGER